jgi:hypothetical protein
MSKLQDEIKTEKFELNKFHASEKDPFKILFYLLKLCHELANEYFYYIENTVTFLYLPGFSCRRISITGAQPQGLATGLSLSITR